MLDELAQHHHEVAPSGDQHVVEAFAAQRAEEAHVAKRTQGKPEHTGGGQSLAMVLAEDPAAPGDRVVWQVVWQLAGLPAADLDTGCSSTDDARRRGERRSIRPCWARGGRPAPP